MAKTESSQYSNHTSSFVPSDDISTNSRKGKSNVNKLFITKELPWIKIWVGAALSGYCWDEHFLKTTCLNFLMTFHQSMGSFV